jgi:hypothetical protein
MLARRRFLRVSMLSRRWKVWKTDEAKHGPRKHGTRNIDTQTVPGRWPSVVGSYGF